MNDIYEPNSSFDFNKLILNKPLLTSGNYFIKYSIEGKPLYVQPPKSTIKQIVIHKSSKKSYCDLLFSQENDEFIKWMETLESYSQQSIYNNRKEWFESELEIEDIENSFTSPIKSYKSGTYYVCRTNMTHRLGKINIKIYDESETDIPIEDICGNMNVVTILEFQGIKCSSKSFQIEIELKQMMVLNTVNLFDTCILKPKTNSKSKSILEELPSNTSSGSIDEPVNLGNVGDVESTEAEVLDEEPVLVDNTVDNVVIEKKEDVNIEAISELTEVEFDLAEIPNTDTIQIKERNDLYYKLYREAIQKARIAKDLALSAYLEAKEIKNKYMLDDISDSELEEYEEEESQNE